MVTTYDYFSERKQVDFITECVEQVLREMYIKNGREYLITEGINISKLVSSFGTIANTFSKAWGIIKRMFTGGSTTKRIINLITGSFSACPGLLVDLINGTKKNYKWITVTQKMLKNPQSVGGTAIKVGQKVAAFTVGKTQKYLSDADFDVIGTIVDAVVAVKDIVVTVLTCCGIAIAKWLDYVINLVLNVIKYWNTKFNSFAARCWTIFKGWLSDSFSINIDQWWSSFQKWFTNPNAAKERATAVSQGARTGVSYHMRR